MMDFCSINELFSWLPFPSTSPQLAAIFFVRLQTHRLRVRSGKIANFEAES